MTATPITLTEKQLAESTYSEAIRVTEAYSIVLRKRRYATYLDPAERARLVDEAEVQLQAAERAEFAAWQQLEYLMKMAIKKPWTAGV
jgi:hypothetical protein